MTYKLKNIRLRMVAGPLLVMLAAAFLMSLMPHKAHAFNLWDDIKINTKWDLGKAAAGGTAIALKHSDALNVSAGDFVPSALAEISDYRMLSVWWGGNQYKLADNSVAWKDTAKIGINLAYIFGGFLNQPPEIIKNLVIGPSLSGNLVTSPHVFVPFLDANYRFGS